MADAPAGSSFEADLRAIREDRGISVDAIEQATRVPADVVRRFEAGALMQDPDYSVVYLRAFVKAYAEALDLSTSQTNAAFDAARQGAYQGDLRSALGQAAQAEPKASAPSSAAKADAPAPKKKEAPAKKGAAMSEADDAPPAKASKTPAAQKPPKKEAPGKPAPAAAPTKAPTPTKEDTPKGPPPRKEAPPQEETPATPPPKPAPPARPADAPPPAVAALAQEPAREPRAAPTTAPPRRSGPPSGVNTSERSWGLIVGIAVLSVVALAVVFFLIFRDPGSDLEPVAAAPAADTTAAPDTTAQQAAVPPAPQIGDTLRVTVVAADGPLQDFRVQEVPDVRRPYWLEQGDEQTFSSAEEVIVWGVETADGWQIDSEARLRVAGLTWAPREVVRLTRANAQALVDSLHQAQYGG